MIFNGLIAAILRSPLHRLMSGSTLLITVMGRKSGRAITTPVNYARTGKQLLITSRTERKWWRNLIGGAPVTVLLQGKTLRGMADTIAGIDAAVVQKLKAFLAERPNWAGQFGVRRGANGLFNADDLARAAGDRVVIEVDVQS
jgi:hypothetical protein